MHYVFTRNCFIGADISVTVNIMFFIFQRLWCAKCCCNNPATTLTLYYLSNYQLFKESAPCGYSVVIVVAIFVTVVSNLNHAYHRGKMAVSS
jgi:hypothetical protein